MTADEGTVDVVREALADSERVDDARIEVRLDDGEVVLSGAVASPEEATVAELVASEHAEAVRSDLEVDPNLREDATEADLAPTPRRPDGGVVTDAHEALSENVPLDPPDDPHV